MVIAKLVFTVACSYENVVGSECDVGNLQLTVLFKSCALCADFSHAVVCKVHIVDKRLVCSVESEHKQVTVADNLTTYSLAFQLSGQWAGFFAHSGYIVFVGNAVSFVVANFVRIVLVDNCRRNIAFRLKICVDVCSSVGFNSYWLQIFLCSAFVSLGGISQSVFARFEVVEDKRTVPLVVGGVSCHFNASFEQFNSHAVQWHIDIVCACGRLVESLAEFLVEVAYDTVDSAGLFCLPSHIVNKTAGIEVAFVTANVVVHGALAGRLVSVEVTFNKESRDTVFQHAKITHVFCSVV